MAFLKLKLIMLDLISNAQTAEGQIYQLFILMDQKPIRKNATERATFF